MLHFIRKCGRFAVLPGMLKDKWGMSPWILEYLALGFSAVLLRGKINTRGILPNQKTWSSFVSSLCRYVRDRDGDVSLAGCSHQIEKSASLSSSTAKSRCVKRRQWPRQLSELTELLCCLLLCKGDAQLHRSWAVSLTTALLFGSHTSVSLPPSLGSDAKFKNHFKNLERGCCSLLDKQLRTCGEDAWNDWWW